jgi:hypothetical protein
MHVLLGGDFFFSLGPVRITAPACTAALVLLCNPKYYIPLSVCSTVPHMRRTQCSSGSDWLLKLWENLLQLGTVFTD